MKILVTGATGFIGRHAVQSLLKDGHTVIGVARNPHRHIAIDWITADLLEFGEPLRAVRSAKPDAILHLAWYTEPGKYQSDPVNLKWVGTTMDLAQAALDLGVRRFCAAGTCYEYEWPVEIDCHEYATPTAPHTLYDRCKSDCRAALEALFSHTSISFAWARIFHAFGPFEPAARLVPSIAAALCRGEPAACSSGTQCRDFMDVRDAGAALAALVTSRVTGSVNIASGHPVTIAEIANMLGNLSGRSDLIRLGTMPTRENDPPRITASVDRLNREVGFECAYPLRSGLENALQFWKQDA